MRDFTKSSTRRAACFCVVLGVAAASGASIANAAFGHRFFKFKSPQTRSADAYGRAVALDGSTALVTELSSQSGPKVHVVDLTTGSHLRALEPLNAVAPPGGFVNSWFGTALALQDGIAAIGARLDSEAALRAGALYLFDVNTGLQLSKIVPSDSVEGHYFGGAVAMDGNTLIVGAHGDNELRGAAYVYDLATGQQRHKLTVPEVPPDDHFGASVDVSGNVAVVGAPSIFFADNRPGSAFIFDAVTGQQRWTLTASDVSPHDNFGLAAAIDGNLAVVGAPGFHGRPGTAYLFDVTTGQELHRFISPNAVPDDQFGYSVAIHGGLVTITTPVHLDPSLRLQYHGAAYVFDALSGDLLTTFVPDTPHEGFGSGEHSIAINESFAIVGASGDRISVQHPYSPGAAYVFDVNRRTADFNQDGIVDATDLDAWKSGFGASGHATLLEGDADFDGDVDGADFLAWQQQLGGAAPNGAAAAGVSPSAPVPEPSVITLLVPALALLLAAARPRGRVSPRRESPSLGETRPRAGCVSEAAHPWDQRQN